MKEKRKNIQIKMGIIGIGGGGSNSVCNIYDSFQKDGFDIGLDYSIVNTDNQDLISIGNRKIRRFLISNKDSSSEGMGAGADPLVGYKSMMDSKELLDDIFNQNDIVFISLGLGGGTGSGATPVLVEEAKKRGILTVIFTTFPWKFEGSNREANARISLNSIYEFADSIIIINNDYLYDDSSSEFENNKKSSLISSLFQKADAYLKNTILAFFSLILERSQINIDLNDIKTALSNSKFGFCFIVSCQQQSNNNVSQEIENLYFEIKRSYVNGLSLENAKYLVVNVAGNEETLNMEIIEGVFEKIKENNDDLQVIFGLSFNPYMDPGEIQFTGIFTGVNYKTFQISELIDSNKTFKQIFKLSK